MKTREIVWLAAFVATSAAAFAQSDLPSEKPRQDFWIPDEAPRGVAVSDEGGRVYVGGSHRAAGPATGCFAAVSLEMGASETGFVRTRLFGGETYAVVPDGAGGWWVGGRFGMDGSLNSRALAHFLPDGTLDPTTPVVGDEVYALRRVGDTLILGGRFESVEGEPRHNLAAIDVETGALLPWSPSVTGENADEDTGIVRDIDVEGTNVYVVGSFEEVNGVDRRHAAAVDLDTGQTLEWDPDLPEHGNLEAVLIAGGRVYVGGCFTSIGGQLRTHLAAIDPVTGDVTPWAPSLDQCVRTLAHTSDRLYVGGRFSTVNSQKRLCAAAFNLSTGDLLPWNPLVQDNDGATTDVRAIVPQGSTVLLGGSFLSVNGQSRHHVAEVDVTSGASTSWRAHAAGPGSSYVRDLVVRDGRLIAAGKFTMLGAELFSNVTAFDTATGRPVLEWTPDVVGRVHAVIPAGDRVYLGGQIERVDGVPRTALAAVDAETGSLIPGFSTAISGYVTNMVLRGSTLYIGGRFGSVDGLLRYHIAAVDAESGEVLPSWDGGVGLPIPLAVEDMTVSPDGQRVYVAGGFGFAGNGAPPDTWPERRGAAAFDAATGQLDEWSMSPRNNDDGWAVLDDGDFVWVGGGFSAFEPIPGALYGRPGVARLRRTDGWPTPWSTWLDGAGVPNGTVEIRRRGDVVYFGGSFSELRANWLGGPAPDDYVRRLGLAAMRVDVPTEVLPWDPRARGAGGSTNPQAHGGPVSGIAISDRSLFVVGGFQTMGEDLRKHPYFAAFDFYCRSDLNGDGMVGPEDLGQLIGAWGSDGLADIDNNGLVSSPDLGMLLSDWGTCEP